MISRKKLRNLAHVEARSALSRGERLLHAEPDEHDRGERRSPCAGQGVDGGSNCRSKVVATVLNQDEEIHGAPPRLSNEMPIAFRRSFVAA